MATPSLHPESGTHPQVPVPDTSTVHEKESLLSETEKPFNVSHAASGEIGTIVTDKRRKRLSIFGAIKEAAGEWTEENAETVKNLDVFQKPVIPTVTPGTERKDIIEKAVSTPHAEAQDDHGAVMERIKTFQSEAERVTGRSFIFKKTDTKKKGWSHILGQEDGKAMPSSGKNFPEVQHIHREDVTSRADSRAFAPAVDVHSTVTLPEAAPHEIPEPKPSAAPVPTPVPIAKPALESQPVPQHEPEPQPIPMPAQRARQFPAAKRSAPQPVPDAQPQPALQSAPIAPRQESGALLVAGIVLVVLLVVGGIGAGAYYFVNRTPVVAGVTVPTFLKTDTRVSLPLPNEKSALTAALKGALAKETGEFLHFYFVFKRSKAEEDTLATAQDVFAVLQPRTSSAFIRSLDERMMIGGIRVSAAEPYLLLKSNAFDVAFAGMLEWEPFMLDDLAPFFGDPLPSNLAFTDKTIANHNVRVLADAEGKERVTYGFVNRNTIILTTTAASFEKLLGALQ